MSTSYIVTSIPTSDGWAGHSTACNELSSALSHAKGYAKLHIVNTRVTRIDREVDGHVTTIRETTIAEFRVTVSVEEVRFETAGDAQ